MSTKTREVIWAARSWGAKMRADAARQEAKKATRAPDRAEAEAWSVGMEGYGGPAQPSPTTGQCPNGGYGWLEIDSISGKLALVLHRQHSPQGAGYADLEAGAVLSMPILRHPPTEQREITPYKWDETQRAPMALVASKLGPNSAGQKPSHVTMRRSVRPTVLSLAYVLRFPLGGSRVILVVFFEAALPKRDGPTSPLVNGSEVPSAGITLP